MNHGRQSESEARKVVDTSIHTNADWDMKSFLLFLNVKKNLKIQLN